MSLHCFNFHVFIIKNVETYWSILCFGCFRMQKTLERYYKYTKERQIDRNGMEQYMQVRPLYLNLITFEISLGKRQYLKTLRHSKCCGHHCELSYVLAHWKCFLLLVKIVWKYIHAHIGTWCMFGIVLSSQIIIYLVMHSYFV